MLSFLEVIKYILILLQKSVELKEKDVVTISSLYGNEKVEIVRSPYECSKKYDYNYKVLNIIRNDNISNRNNNDNNNYNDNKIYIYYDYSDLFTNNIKLEEKYYFNIIEIYSNLTLRDLPHSMKELSSDYTDKISEATQLRNKGFYEEALNIYIDIINKLGYIPVELDIYMVKILISVGAISKAFFILFVVKVNLKQRGMIDKFVDDLYEKIINSMNEFDMYNNLDYAINMIENVSGYNGRELRLSTRLLKWELINSCLEYKKNMGG